MPDATQVGPVVTYGRLVFDFGPANQQAAWELVQALRMNRITITIDGEPA